MQAGGGVGKGISWVDTFLEVCYTLIMNILTLDFLKENVASFAREISKRKIRELYGTTDGKAIGTYIEHAFHEYLKEKGFEYEPGSSASGIDFPVLEVDMKTTRITQPQSSCPFEKVSQKVYGLGYHLIVFVYEKEDDPKTRSAHLNFSHAIFAEKEYTADYQTTKGIIGILEREGNKDDIVAFLEERNLPLDEIGRQELAEQISRNPPQQGYLTISNALQWRLQYSRIVHLVEEGSTDGIENLLF